MKFLHSKRFGGAGGVACEAAAARDATPGTPRGILNYEITHRESGAIAVRQGPPPRLPVVRHRPPPRLPVLRHGRMGSPLDHFCSVQIDTDWAFRKRRPRRPLVSLVPGRYGSPRRGRRRRPRDPCQGLPLVGLGRHGGGLHLPLRRSQDAPPAPPQPRRCGRARRNPGQGKKSRREKTRFLIIPFLAWAR